MRNNKNITIHVASHSCLGVKTRYTIYVLLYESLLHMHIFRTNVLQRRRRYYGG